tara:strand:- start:528 stop:1328 length:801 start_codon:yes stop_codon:yes gene_type:complete
LEQSRQEIINEFTQSLKKLSSSMGYTLIENESLEELDRKIKQLNFLKNIDKKNLEMIFKNIDDSKSQIFQDIFVLSELNFKKNGFFVEFGAADGLLCSNTFLLEKKFNWNGILSEPAFFWIDKLKENRSTNISNKCVWSKSREKLNFREVNFKLFSTLENFKDDDMHGSKRIEGKNYNVESISLNDLLEEYKAPNKIDYISIDTEGSELEILKSFDFDKYSVNVFTVEHNFSDNRQSIYELMKENGYIRKYENISWVDDWFVLGNL